MKEKKVAVTVIHSNEAIPVNRVNWPFMELEVGQNFEVPIEKRSSVASRVSFLNKSSGRTFVVRKINDTSVGVWRTK